MALPRRHQQRACGSRRSHRSMPYLLPSGPVGTAHPVPSRLRRSPAMLACQADSWRRAGAAAGFAQVIHLLLLGRQAGSAATVEPSVPASNPAARVITFKPV